MELLKTRSYKDKKIFVRPGLNDITYLCELTPHPASQKESYGFLGVGLIRRREDNF